jgi:hypothetical protein
MATISRLMALMRSARSSALDMARYSAAAETDTIVSGPGPEANVSSAPRKRRGCSSLARRLHNLPEEPRPSREEVMHNRAVRVAFRRTREAFNRYMRLEAKGDPGQSRALRDYVDAHAEFTRLIDEDLRQERWGARRSRPAEPSQPPIPVH